MLRCGRSAGRAERTPAARVEAATARAPAQAVPSGAMRADAGAAGEQRAPRAGHDRGLQCGAGGVAAAAGALSRAPAGMAGPGERAPAACSTPGGTACAAEGGLALAGTGRSSISSPAACGQGGGGSASGGESAGRAAPGSTSAGARGGGACAQAQLPPAAGVAFARARLPDSSDSEGDHTPASGLAGDARGAGVAALPQCSAGVPAAHEPCGRPEGASHGGAARGGDNGGAGSPPRACSGAAPGFERARLRDSSDSSGSSMGGRDVRIARQPAGEPAGGGGAGARDAGGTARARVAAGGRAVGRVAFKRVRMDDSSDEGEGPGAASRPGRRVLLRAGSDAQRAAPEPASPGAERAPWPASPGAGDARGGSGCPARADCAAGQAAAPHVPAPPPPGPHVSTQVLPAAGAHASAPALLPHSSAPRSGTPGAGQPRCEARGQCQEAGVAAGAGPAGAGAAVVGSTVSELAPAAGAPPPGNDPAAAASAAAPPLVVARSDTELRIDGQLTTWTRARPVCLAARSCCGAVGVARDAMCPWRAALQWPAQPVFLLRATCAVMLIVQWPRAQSKALPAVSGAV
jgi:hypothetical protein